ncbi:MAG: DUF5134 domain-containing protein [Trebonia sp.]
MTPAWLLDAVAALTLAVAAVSAARLLAARPWRRGAVLVDTDLAHLLMAIAMAGMLAPALRTLPDVPWEAIFGLLAAWFAIRVAGDARTNGVRALAGGHCAPHLVHGCSMLYMFQAMTVTAAGASGTTGMAGIAGGAGPAMTLAHPTLALLFAFILVGYSIWDLDQLSGRRYSLAAARVSLAGAAAPGIPVPGLPAPGLRVPGLRVSGLPVLGHPVRAGVEPRSLVPPDSSQHPDPADAEAAGVRDHARAGAMLLSPAVTIGCRVAMGIAMAFMLFIAI